mgnify:CR=1 FL=1
MKKNYTHVAILLDRSGSMQSIKSDVIGGFNQLIEDQKKIPGELTVSLIQFDENLGLQYDVINDFSPISEVQLLNESNYIPRGMTPLNDSLAKLINETGSKLASWSESDRPEKVLIVSITDGLENKSKEHTKSSIKELISHQEGIYKWQFMYIGANQDAFAEGSDRGIKASYKFDANSMGTKKMSKVMSSTLASYRSSTSDSFDLAQTLAEESLKADREELENK